MKIYDDEMNTIEEVREIEAARKYVVAKKSDQGTGG